MEIKKGIGVDIDETLAFTALHWMTELQRLFGNPENLSPQGIIDKYIYAQNVPYWQTEEALKWMEEKRHSNEFQKNLPLIENSNHFLNKISKIIPISAYITIRPEVVREGTEHWLMKHGFPKAPIILKPNSVLFREGNKWKAKVIEDLFPNLVGFIDDNLNLVNSFSNKYKGIIFFYNKKEIKSDLNLIQCKDWEQVYKEVKQVFGKK